MKIIVIIIGGLLLSVNAVAQSVNDLFNYEKHQEFAAQVVSSKDIDSLITFEKIVIDGYDSKVPFYHFNNKKNTNERYMILLHGLGSSKEDWVYPSMPYFQWTKNLTEIKDSLLVLGFNIIIPDAKYHGERSYELNFRDPGSLPPALSKSQADADIFYDLYKSSIKEVRLIMDYFEDSTKESKPEFNLMGYSMGGAFSLILNTIDERINSVVACVPPLTHPYSELQNLNWSGEIVEKMKVISPLYYATDQKSPIVMLMGKTDFFITMDEAREFYKRISIDDKKLKFYESGHELPTNYISDVISWITQHN